MNRRNIKRLGVFIFLGVVGPGLGNLCDPVRAEVADRINFQGRLIDPATNNPKNGPFNMTFRICDSAAGACTGGNLLWTETQTNVSVSNGLFAVQLGFVHPYRLKRLLKLHALS